MIKITFLFLGLLGEDVAVVSVFPLDFSRPGKRETLFGTGIGFKLCHCSVVFINKYYLPLNCGLFLFDGRYHNVHTLALQRRHILGTAEFLELDCETQKLLLALVLEHYRTAAEEYRRLDLRTLLEELLSVLQLELEVVFVGVGAETDLLHDDLGGVGFHLLGLLLLLIQILLVVEYLAHRRIGLVADQNQIELKLIREGQSLGKGIYPLLGDVISHQANLGCGYLLVDKCLILIALLLESRVGLASFVEA